MNNRYYMCFFSNHVFAIANHWMASIRNDKGDLGFNLLFSYKEVYNKYSYSGFFHKAKQEKKSRYNKGLRIKYDRGEMNLINNQNWSVNNK